MTAEIISLRMGPHQAAMREALAEGLARGNHSARLLAALDLALDFHTWRTLVRRGGLSREEAVETMVSTLRCVRRRSSPSR
ncbi:MAG: hypothetical protein ICV69_05900 [Thermoleophilaceae bacterium]|nr:hypothetical protein [Thermoleophilaceae bacterium]